MNENNEIMEIMEEETEVNDVEVIVEGEETDEVYEISTGKMIAGLAVVAGAGALAYKYIAKPAGRKIKEWWNNRKSKSNDATEDEVANDCDCGVESTDETK